MTALAIVLAVLVLLALTPVGVLFVYDGAPTVWATLAFIRIKVYPLKPKTPKQLAKAEEKRKRRKERRSAKKLVKTEEKKPERSFKEMLNEIQAYLKLGVDVLGTVRRRMLIRELAVRVVLAGDDPAKLGANCGYAWTAIGALEPLLAQTFRIRKRNLAVVPDFLGSKTSVTARVSARLLLCQAPAIGIKYGIWAIRILMKQNKKGKVETQ